MTEPPRPPASDAPPPPSSPGSVNVTLGDASGAPSPLPGPLPGPQPGPQPGQGAATAPQRPQTRPPVPGRAARDATLEAVTALRQEVRALREAIDPSPDDTGSSGPATLESLSQSVRTLETYLSIGFFDRVKAALGESAEHLRPVALEQRVRRLRRLVWLVMLVQLIVLGLILALSWPTVTALAQATRVAITGWLGFDTGSP